MEYPSFKIGNKDTFRDWQLYTWKDWVLDRPETKTIFVDIPLGDGTIDLTQALSGLPRYNDRMLSIPLLSNKDYYEFHKLYDDIKSYCHGKKMDIEIPTRRGYFLRGTVDITNYSWDGFGTITMEILCEPYFYKSGEVFYQKGEIVPRTPLNVTVTNNGDLPISPTFNFDGRVAVTIEGQQRILLRGTYRMDNFTIPPKGSKVATFQNLPEGNYIADVGLSYPMGQVWSTYSPIYHPNYIFYTGRCDSQSLTAPTANFEDWFRYHGVVCTPLEDGFMRVLLQNTTISQQMYGGTQSSYTDLIELAPPSITMPFIQPGAFYQLVVEIRQMFRNSIAQQADIGVCIGVNGNPSAGTTFASMGLDGVANQPIMKEPGRYIRDVNIKNPIDPRYSINLMLDRAKNQFPIGANMYFEIRISLWEPNTYLEVHNEQWEPGISGTENINYSIEWEEKYL